MAEVASDENKPRRRGREDAAAKDVADGYFAAVAARDLEAMAGFWHDEIVGDLVPIGVSPEGRSRASSRPAVRIELRGVDCVETAAGKIVHNTAYYDGAAFARAIGMLPPRDSGVERAMTTGFNALTKLRRTLKEIPR